MCLNGSIKFKSYFPNQYILLGSFILLNMLLPILLYNNLHKLANLLFSKKTSWSVITSLFLYIFIIRGFQNKSIFFCNHEDFHQSKVCINYFFISLFKVFR